MTFLLQFLFQWVPVFTGFAESTMTNSVKDTLVAAGPFNMGSRESQGSQGQDCK